MDKDWTMADLEKAIKNSDVEIDYDKSTGLEGIDRIDPLEWTQTEIRFAKEMLEPGLRNGQIVAWWNHPLFRLPFCNYTPDFAALLPHGTIVFYEIKGKYRLGSAGRSSLAVRALRYFVKAENVLVWRCSLQDDESWKIEEIKIGLAKGPHEYARSKKEDNDAT